MSDCRGVDVRELAAAKELRGASRRDLDLEDEHIAQDIHLEAVDAEAVRDVAHRQCFQNEDEEHNGMYEDKVAEDMLEDGCSTPSVLAVFQMHWQAGSVGDEQYWK